jgi:hypothetical protein
VKNHNIQVGSLFSGDEIGLEVKFDENLNLQCVGMLDDPADEQEKLVIFVHCGKAKIVAPVELIL